MNTINFKKPKEKVKINYLIKKDQVELRTEKGSILKCRVESVDTNAGNLYKGSVLNSRKTKEGIIPGKSVEFFIDDVYGVLRVGSEHEFRTIKSLHDMLEAGCSNDEILKKTEQNLMADVYLFNDTVENDRRKNNRFFYFFDYFWSKFSYNSVYEVKSKFGK